MIIPEDPDLTSRVRKFINFVIQGEIIVKTPIVNRNGSKNVSGHYIAHRNDNLAYQVVPRVYWKREIDGHQHVIRIRSKEHSLDLEEFEDLQKELDFPLTHDVPQFVLQMAQEDLFKKNFGNNPFWVMDLRYGPDAIRREADAYKTVKRILMTNGPYLKMMEIINNEWDRCYNEKDRLLQAFLNDDKQKVKREKEFVKKLMHFLSGHHKFTLDASPETLHYILSLEPELLKDISRFIKRNDHDIPYMEERVIKEASDKAKVGAVMKS